MGSVKSTNESRGSATENANSKPPSPDYQPPTSQAQNYAMVDLKGRPVDKSKTGTWKAAPFLYAICLGNFVAVFGVPLNLVPYLANTMHQSISKSSNITTDVVGTSYILSVLGGFVADSYLGSFYTICAGGTITLLGFGLLTLSTALSTLQPAPCSRKELCKPAGSRYMGALYAALYTIAFGSGLLKPNNISLGGDQFDDSNPKERKQSVHFYIWFYLFAVIGLSIAATLGVYLQDDVSRSWGYGFALMAYGVCFLFFLFGVTKLRHKIPSGSFLTRAAQVLVASLRKWKAPMPENPQELCSSAPTALSSFNLPHTSKLRFFDRAAIIDEVDREAILRGRPDPWRVCSVTQVEESKRLTQLVPICLTTACVTLVFSQMTTFTVQQGGTLDRRLGKHFVIPPASLIILADIAGLVCLPVYDKIIFPLARRCTKSPYGFPPLQRLGASLVFSILTMISAALVERKRLTYVRELHLEALPLGAYSLPMEFWYLLPQFFCTSQVEFFLYVSSFQFFYHEVAGTTRSVGSSFTYTASALGYFFSTIIVNITNHVTRNDKGGAWLQGQLNNGGLEKFYWLLTVFIGVNLILFMIVSYFYEYKHDWFDHDTPKREKQIPLSQNQVDIVHKSP